MNSWGGRTDAWKRSSLEEKGQQRRHERGEQRNDSVDEGSNVEEQSEKASLEG